MEASGAVQVGEPWRGPEAQESNELAVDLRIVSEATDSTRGATPWSRAGRTPCAPGRRQRQEGTAHREVGRLRAREKL